MSHPHSLPDNTAQVSESGFLFHDWALPEKNPAEPHHFFDGKIIARMPDLASECFARGDEKSLSRFYWGKKMLSDSPVVQRGAFPAPVARLQLFHRITAFGCVVVLCGLMLMLFDQGDKSVKNTPDITEIVAEGVKIPITDFGEIIVSTSVAQPEPTEKISDIPSSSVIPVAPAENFATVLVAAASPPDQVQSGHVQSVWNRPPGDSYSPWNVTQRQPEEPSTEVASLEPSQTHPKAQAVLSNTVAMAPMVDLSMPVSPYEQQWLAQSNSPPVQVPVDPFMQLNNHAGSSMMPVQNQWVSEQAVAARPNDQRVPPPPYPQSFPPSAAHGMPVQYPYNQIPPSSVPIPSGISTLPSQGGYYQQHSGGATSYATPNPNSYHNVSPTHRRVY